MQGIAGRDHVGQITSLQQQRNCRQFTALVGDGRLGQGDPAAVLHQGYQVGGGATVGGPAQGFPIDRLACKRVPHGVTT